MARSSWQSLPPYPLPTMQNQSFPILLRTLARLWAPPSPAPDGSPDRLTVCAEDTASGQFGRVTSTPVLSQKHALSQPAYPPAPRLTCQFRITFPPRKTRLILLSFLQNTMHREELHLLSLGLGRAVPGASYSTAGPWVPTAPLVIPKCLPRAGKHRHCSWQGARRCQCQIHKLIKTCIFYGKTTQLA